MFCFISASCSSVTKENRTDTGGLVVEISYSVVGSSLMEFTIQCPDIAE